MAQETRRLARDLRAGIEWQRLLGADELPLALPAGASLGGRGAAVESASGDASLDPRMASAPAPAESARVLPGGRGAAVQALVSTAGDAALEPWREAADLDGMRAAILDCRRCRLCERRTQVVFGVGNPRARLVFVGEGPGHDEDVKGEPFVGRAGQLLTDIIEKGMRIARSDVYICNVVKCRPPENRNPEPDEVAACSPFLLRQIDLVRPEVLVTLGKFAAQTLLETKTPITRLRGTWQEFRGIPLMPTFHPAYLLRNPADKKLVWQDIQQVMARLALPA